MEKRHYEKNKKNTITIQAVFLVRWIENFFRTGPGSYRVKTYKVKTKSLEHPKIPNINFNWDLFFKPEIQIQV